MRYAAVTLALCAAAIAIPLDTSSVTGLTDIADTSNIIPDTGDILPGEDDGVLDILDADNLIEASAVPEITSREVDTDSLTSIADIESVTGIVPDTGSILPRQNHPAGPLQKQLKALLGPKLFAKVSKDVHQTGIAVANLEHEIKSIITPISPELGLAYNKLIHQVSELEAVLVSTLGFNT